jgi:hypothetical protein
MGRDKSGRVRKGLWRIDKLGRDGLGWVGFERVRPRPVLDSWVGRVGSESGMGQVGSIFFLNSKVTQNFQKKILKINNH